MFVFLYVAWLDARSAGNVLSASGFWVVSGRGAADRFAVRAVSICVGPGRLTSRVLAVHFLRMWSRFGRSVGVESILQSGQSVESILQSGQSVESIL